MFMIRPMKTTALAILLMTLASLTSSFTAMAKPRMIVVVEDGLSSKDLLDSGLPHLSSLGIPVAVGLMNTRTDGNYSPEDAYVSIGSGARSKATELTGNISMNASEPFGNMTAAETFYGRTGRKLPAMGVGVLDIARILSDNTDPQFKKLLTKPGGIGDALHSAHLKTGVLGNADAMDAPRRHIATMVMDSWGTVDLGDVSQGILKADPMSPTGVSTDYDRLLAKAQEFLPKVDLLMVELGDTSRADFMAETVIPEQLGTYRAKAIGEAGRFIARLADMIDPKQDAILVISPTPSKMAKKDGNYLTPIFAMGSGFPSGYATSPSTRWKGIITNTDIAATILGRFGLPQVDGMVGRPMTVSGDASDLTARLSKLDAMNDDSVTRNRQRSLVLKINNTILLILMIAVSLLIALKPRYPRDIKGVAAKSGIFASCIPMAFLLHALLPAMPIGLTIPLLVAVTAALGATASALFKEPWKAVSGISLLTSVLILADLWTGLNISRHSLLSYNAVEGARFYGIGNELSGVAIGSALVGSVLLTGKDLPNRRVTAILATSLFFLFLMASIALPGVGAEFGSTLPCILGLGIYMFAICGVKPSRKTMAYVALAGVLLVAAFIALDLRRGEQVSHVGRLVQGIQTGGVKELVFVVQRKLAVNIKLIRKTLWSRVLVALILPWLAVMYKGGFQALESRATVLKPLGITALVTAAGVLVLNDSGVVGACTLLLFPAAFILAVYGGRN